MPGEYELGFIDGRTEASGELVRCFLARLEELRKDPSEDAILDLMDRVEGWCSPHQRLVPESESEKRYAHGDR